MFTDRWINHPFSHTYLFFIKKIFLLYIILIFLFNMIILLTIAHLENFGCIFNQEGHCTGGVCGNLLET